MTVAVKLQYPGRWAEVCDVDELIDGEAMTFRVEGYEVYVVMKDGEIYAYYARCPHAFTELGSGDFDGEKIVCSAHQWEFDPVTGDSINPRGSKLFPFESEVRDGKLYVKVPDMPTLDFKEKYFKMYMPEGENE